MSIEDAGKAVELLKKDWDSLPNILKFSYLNSVFTLIVIWLFKDIAVNFKLFSHTINTTVPKLGLIIFFVFIIIIPVLNWIITRLKIGYYRSVYPIKDIGKNYHYRVEGNAVQIIDTKRKVIRWVETSKTAYDLGYYQSIWSEMIQRKNFIMSAKEVNLDQYSLKRGIRTRGKPGE